MDEENHSEEKDIQTPGPDALKLRKTLLIQKIAITTLTCVVAVGAVVGIGYKSGWFGDTNTKPVVADIDPNAGEWDGTVPEAPKGDPNAESIALPGYPQIYIPAGQTDVAVAFSNPEGNPCYFTFQLVLKDTEEVLYESKQVPPGEAITNITLSKALDAGNYPAILKVTTASILDLSPMNGANMETMLEVK